MTSGHGGCLGKVDSESLLALLAEAGLGTTSRSAFRDADFALLPDAGTTLATSTDLIFDFGLPAADFGWTAATHALSDLYAVLSTPFVATVTLGTSRRDLRNGTTARILQGAVAALGESATRLGGGHTVYSEQAFVSVTAVGIGDPPRVGFVEGQKYALLLSKPLGTGVYAAALRNSLLEGADVTDLVTVLRASNAAAALSLKDAAAQDQRAIGLVTDVTGFGLVLAVHSRLRTGWRAVINVSSVPCLPRTMEMIDQCGLITQLGESNMFAAEKLNDFVFSRVDMSARIALSDPQTSGGLVAAVKIESLPQVLQARSVEWVQIGTVRQSRNDEDATVLLVE